NRVITGVRSNSSTIFTTHHRLARGWFEIFQLKPITMLSGNSLDDLVNVALIFWVELLPDVDSYAINSYRYDPHLLALLYQSCGFFRLPSSRTVQAWWSNQ